MNKSIEEYIQKADLAIRMVRLEKIGFKDKKRLNTVKKEIISKLNSEDKFLISSDYPQDNEDIEILKKVLKIDEKIVYLTDKLDNVKELKEIFPDRVFEVDEDLYILAFTVDIHIYFWDKILYKKLEENGRNFWNINPKYANDSITNEIQQPKEEIQFLCKDEYNNINTKFDFIKCLYKNCLTKQEVQILAESSGIEVFYLDIKFSVQKLCFLNLIYWQREKMYEYRLQKEKFDVHKKPNANIIAPFLAILSSLKNEQNKY